MESLSGFYIWLVALLIMVYFIFVVWIGRKGLKVSRKMGGFATARGQVSPWLVGASFGASFASANLFIGVPGWAYTYGVSVLWWTLGAFGVTWIGLLFFAKRFWIQAQQSREVHTLPQWLGKRYSSRLIQIVVSLLILFNIYYIVGQNVGLATLAETVLGSPYLLGIVLGVLITVLYIGMGGAYAQIVTDGIQGIFMSAASLVIFVSLLWTIGGGWSVFGNLQTQLSGIDPALTSLFSDGCPFYSVFAILSVQWLMFSFVLLPNLSNKTLSIKEEKDLRPFTLSAGLTLFFVSTFAVFGGLAARVLVPNLAVADQAIGVYMLEAFSPLIVVLLVTAFISVILSTTDSLYLGITSSIGNDLYKNGLAPLIHRHNPLSNEELDQKAVQASRISLIFIAAITLYLSIDRPASLTMLTQFGISAIISGVVAPVTLGYFWSRANRKGAIASILSGTGCYMLIQITGLVPSVFESLVFGSLAGFSAMILFSLLTRTEEMEENYRYIKKQAS
ncbi:sodium:solute symporter family transporter [Alteribacter natronophilus]|uniref:sodium:solute symporter family transporter n=1 Tax=Alteribacter natronophilus TaxID=2583810 RepID=UPI00110F6613|nr:sodium:solute symporter family protein [Alteribacter natronophilus]TMW70751.1 sodium:solute symporter family protein [Alteribacter natronophilus]